MIRGDKPLKPLSVSPSSSVRNAEFGEVLDGTDNDQVRAMFRSSVRSLGEEEMYAESMSSEIYIFLILEVPSHQYIICFRIFQIHLDVGGKYNLALVLITDKFDGTPRCTVRRISIKNISVERGT